MEVEKVAMEGVEEDEVLATARPAVSTHAPSKHARQIK